MSNLTVCILAAGSSTRTQNISALHKCLLPINNKAVISNIIDKFNQYAEFVIALGYQKEIIKDYLKVAHSGLKITIVEVDNFNGPNSGPGYSLHCCKQYLQQPFYLFCSDCLVDEELPPLDHNWLGLCPIKNPNLWSTAKVKNNQIIEFKNKSEDGFYLGWIGVAGVKDFKTFWTQLDVKSTDKEFELVRAFYKPLEYNDLQPHFFTWHDTGTVENYTETSKKLNSSSLGMPKIIAEATYHYNNQCIKVFANNQVCLDRITRAENKLKDVVPNLTHKSDYAYAYQWVSGKNLYETTNIEIFKKLLNWCESNLWEHEQNKEFKTICLEFYKNKTIKRLEKYFELNGIKELSVINNQKCYKIQSYLDNLNWDLICGGIPCKFHGDLQFENIIYSDEGEFKLIDWRDRFIDCLQGDLYYDLAKLYGGLCISYNYIKKNEFKVHKLGDEINYYFYVPDHLNAWKLYFENWLLKNNYNLLKIRLMTALIYLNMAPLHTAPFNELLFNHSRYLLELAT